MKNCAFSIIIFITSFSNAQIPNCLDLTFGTNGYGILVNSNASSQAGSCFKLSPDSSIWLGGAFLPTSGGGQQHYLAHYYSNGMLDSSKGTNGIISTFINASINIYDMALVGDRIYLLSNLNGTSVICYDTSGNLSATFGTNGVYSFPVSNYMISPLRIGVQSNGKILIASIGNGSNKVTFSRLNIGGTIDSTFGVNGFKSTNSNIYAPTAGFDVDPQDRILLSLWEPLNSGNLAVLRYTSNGILDSSFAINGKYSTNFAGSNNYGQDALFLPNNQILIMCKVYNSTTTTYSYGLLKLNDDGTFDGSFGKKQIAFPGISNYLFRSFIESDGNKILLSTAEGRLYRLNFDASIDSSFCGIGYVITNGGMVSKQLSNRYITGGYLTSTLGHVLDAYLTNSTTTSAYDDNAIKYRITLNYDYLNSILYLNMWETDGIVKNIHIYDISGKLISKLATKNSLEELDLYNFSQGVYLIYIYGKDFNKSLKFIK